MRNANDQKPSVNVLELLAAQHAEVDALLEVIEKKRPDRREAFAILANKVAAHATVEEKIFYPAVMAKQTDELLHEAVEEHLEIKRCLADLLTMDPGDASFDAKISVLKEDLAHHAHEEEEGKLFPILAK